MWVVSLADKVLPRHILTACLTICTLANACVAGAQEESSDADTDVLTSQQWERLDESVERSLQWLARQQQRDGSFPTLVQGQPGVTGIVVMAFAAHGHTPGQGPYGEVLNRAINYIVRCQQANGLVAVIAPRGTKISRNVSRDVGETATYNHGISSLALSEVYACSHDASELEIRETIENSIKASLEMQRWPKVRKVDQGGWRYLDLLPRDGEPVDSNLSNTVWQMLFLRSAKNAGFDVPQESVDGAVRFIRNCFNPKYNTFVLMPSYQDHRTRGMSGAGVIALALAGLHDTEEARTAGDWILKNTFLEYNKVEPFGQRGFLDDRYHHGVFFCTQATFQLGGRYWREFFPPMVEVLLENQRSDGSWEPESHTSDRKFGNAYTTALMALSLGAPNQLLPVLQR
ncbi:MAG: prenyltransferase/squalene oxidase repeat-containing protein [Planctomycetota bacterium]